MFGLFDNQNKSKNTSGDIINEKTVMKSSPSCFLNSSDVAREQLLTMSHLERSSMTLKEQKNRANNSQLQVEEWNDLFHLAKMDKAEQITCQDPHNVFNETVFN